MVFQVLSVNIFEKKQKKNIKGRVNLSDGVSKIAAMISDKVYNALCEKGKFME